MMWFTIFIGTLAAFYCYVKVKFSFWESRGVPFKKPHWLLGNFAEHTKGKISWVEATSALYDEFKGEKFFGTWLLYTPTLFIVDRALLRDVMTRDFGVWSVRGVAINQNVDPLSAHIVHLTGHKWKLVREKLTPIFTSETLKNMQKLLLECCKEFKKHMDVVAVDGRPVDVKEMSAKFTTDVIGLCVFGIRMNAMLKEDAIFRKMGRKMAETTFRKKVTRLLQITFPRFYRFLNVPFWNAEITEFFLRVMKVAFEYREKNNVRRDDFVDLLRDLKNTGEPLAEGEIEFDDKLLTAQAFIFFTAGFETSSTAISYCLHELAVNQDIQERLREELINATTGLDGGEISWDGLKSIEYLDMVLQETMRKHPPVPVVTRASVEPYKIPGTDVELPAGTLSIIPIYAIHHDPEYYPDPAKFDPERFTEEAKRQRPPFTYLPFGQGPRNCIGSRFAEQQTKLGIYTVIKNFTVSLCEKSQNPLQHDPNARFLACKDGIWIRLSRHVECYHLI